MTELIIIMKTRREDSFITPAEVAEGVTKLPGGKAPGVDEICPETLKALDIVGLSCLTFLFSVPWRFGTEPLQCQTDVVAPVYKKGECAAIVIVSHCSASRLRKESSLGTSVGAS